ncbi:MAG: response regulator [Nitrospirae bacterium]|nr:response regulator [Nitrospirota bacterium]
MYDLNRFDLHDMAMCGAALRRLGLGAASLEEVAGRVTRYFYEHLRIGTSGPPACALVRFFKTHPYQHLDPSRQEAARTRLGRAPDIPAVRCLTLLGSAGHEPEWNNPNNSRRYRAIPLLDEEAVRQLPMVAQLFHQLDPALLPALVRPGANLVLDTHEHSYNVFFVQQAKESPFVPVQADFVLRYGVESVLGFGGTLPGGEVFAVILFSTVPLAPETADLFRAMAPCVKLAALPFEPQAVFADGHPDRRGTDSSPPSDDSRYWAKVAAQELLLVVYEQVVVEQTERLARSSAALAEARDHAMEASRLKSQFLANMSHEIRTPLNGVLGMTDLLLDTPLSSDQRELADAVQTSGQSLLTLINDILDFSKIEADRMELETIDFDLRTTVEDTVAILSGQSYAKGLELCCLIQADVPSQLRGDPARIRQILINLVGNAVKFTASGELVVEVKLEAPETREALHVQREASESGNEVCFTNDERRHGEVLLHFSVRDTGIGMTPEVQRRLFQAFTQGDGSTTRRFGGTGLGLAICKQLAELMQGTFGVTSEPDRGSRFWFSIPFGRSQSPPADAPTWTDLRGVRTLIVDDHATNRLILSQYCQEWDMPHETAAGGPQALVLLRAAVTAGQSFDLAILDVKMPEMDGLELAAEIREDPALAGTRLVVVTAMGQRGDADVSEAVGVRAYLTKPIRKYQLYDGLTVVMGAKSKDKGRSGPAPSLVTRHSLRETESRARGRVLVVEDNVVNQKVAVRMVQKLGFGVDLAANGREALEAVVRMNYVAILMDCQMQDMDGFEATRAIREREALNVKREAFESDTRNASRTTSDAARSRVPIIAMTANAMQGDRELCLAAGMDDYVSKPIQFQALGEVLSHWAASPAGLAEPESASSA